MSTGSYLFYSNQLQGSAPIRTLDMSETPEVTGWFSEEDGRKDCPGGKAMRRFADVFDAFGLSRRRSL